MILNLRTYRRTADFEPVSFKMSDIHFSQNQCAETQPLPESEVPLTEQGIEELRRNDSWRCNLHRHERHDMTMGSVVRVSHTKLLFSTTEIQKIV